MAGIKASGKLSTRKNGVAGFLKKVRDVKSMTKHGRPPGRLVFIMDATASRQPTWDQAMHIQAGMFSAVDSIGRLEIQLVYFRGTGGFYASGWKTDSQSLLRDMTGVSCQAGQTMIERSLKHVLDESMKTRVSSAVFIGDACEESPGGIYKAAGQLGVLKVPVFMFQENFNDEVEGIYRNVARLSGGAYCRFDSGSPEILKKLLSAVAVYAAGGREALKSFASNNLPELQDMTRQLLR